MWHFSIGVIQILPHNNKMNVSDAKSPAITFEAPTGASGVVAATNVNPASAFPEVSDTNISNSSTVSKQQDDREGILFDETTEQERIEAPDTLPTIAVCEPTWDMKKFFALPVRIRSGTWTTTTTQGTVLTEMQIPNFMYAYERWLNVMYRYMFFRCKFRFRLELNGTNFHAGKLVMSVMPAGTRAIPTLPPKMVSAIPSVSLYPSNNNVVEIDAPWIAPCEYFTTQPPSNGGLNQTSRLPYSLLSISVFNQLTAGVGASTSLNWTLYASVLDMELAVPRASLGVAQGLIDVTTINNNIQNMENSTMPVNITGDAYDVQAGLPGLDLPADQESPHIIQRVATSSNHQVRGTPSIQRLSPYPNSQNVCSRYNFETPYDEMTIKFLKTRNNFIATAPVSITDTFGKIVFQAAITPAQDILSIIDDATLGPLELLAKLFGAWRGDIKFCVEVIATQFHTAKLFCGIQYGVDQVVDFSIGALDPTTVYGKVIEVNKAKGCFEIVAPFQYPLPWAPCYDYDYTWDDGTNVILPTFKSNQYPYVQPCSSIGTFFIAVLNPLVVPANVSTTIALNVYKKGMDNLEFHTLCGTSLNARPSAQKDEVGTRDCAVKSTTMSNLNERMYSLRDILKRFRLAWQFRIQPMISAAGISFTGAFRYINLGKAFASGSFQQIMSNYRAYAGDLRLKVIASFNNSSANLSQTVHIIYLPPIFSVTGQNFDQVYCTNAAAALLTLADNTTTAEAPIRINPSASIYTTQQPMLGFPNSGATAIVRPAQQGCVTSEVLTSTAPVREFEIPYYSQSRYVNVPFVNDAWAISGYSENPYGYLVFVQYNTNSGALTSTSIGAEIAVYAAGGDSIRCAHYIPSFEDADSDIEITRTGSSLKFIAGTAATIQ